MKIFEVEAKNKKEAVKSAASFLKVDEELITTSVYRKSSGNFLGLGKGTNLYSINAVKGKTPLSVVAQAVLFTIIKKMGYQCELKGIKTLENNKICIDFTSNQTSYLIGKRGRTLESLQFLVNLMIEKFIENSPKILLDTENYRDRRAEQLSSMSQKFAKSVMLTGKSKRLDPLNPYERRVVHLALQELDGIQTISEGSGIYKRIRIQPTEKKSLNSVLIDQESEQNANYQQEELPPEMYHNTEENTQLKDEIMPDTSS